MTEIERDKEIIVNGLDDIFSDYDSIASDLGKIEDFDFEYDNKELPMEQIIEEEVEEIPDSDSEETQPLR